MDRITAKSLQQEVEEALKGVAQRRGLTIIKNSAAFSPTDCSISIKFADTSEDTRRERFEKLAPIYGIPANAFNKVVTIQGRQLVVIDIDPARPSFPVVLTELGSDKKTFARAHAVLIRLGSASTAVA